MSDIAPRSAMAEMVRKVLGMHDDWDAPHQFVTLDWDGEHLTPGTVAIIDPAIDPGDYPEVMAKIAAKQIAADMEHLPYAYLLQIEGFGMTEPPPSASDEDRARFNQARRDRTFSQQPDSVEICTVWCADIHGRLWSATKTRGKPGDPDENFYAPGSKPVGGRMVNALLSIAEGTGALRAGAN